MRPAQTSEAAGPGHGELQPLPGRHGNEESWKASERYLQIFIEHNMTPECVREYNAVCKPRDMFRGWGAQGFPTPEVDFPSLESLKCI